MLHRKVRTRARKLSVVCTNSFCCEEEPKLKRHKTWNGPFDSKPGPSSPSCSTSSDLSLTETASCITGRRWFLGDDEDVDKKEQQLLEYDCTECKLNIRKYKGNKSWYSILRMFAYIPLYLLQCWIQERSMSRSYGLVTSSGK